MNKQLKSLKCISCKETCNELIYICPNKFCKLWLCSKECLIDHLYKNHKDILISGLNESFFIKSKGENVLKEYFLFKNFKKVVPKDILHKQIKENKSNSEIINRLDMNIIYRVKNKIDGQDFFLKKQKINDDLFFDIDEYVSNRLSQTTERKNLKKVKFININQVIEKEKESDNTNEAYPLFDSFLKYKFSYSDTLSNNQYIFFEHSSNFSTIFNYLIVSSLSNLLSFLKKLIFQLNFLKSELNFSIGGFTSNEVLFNTFNEKVLFSNFINLTYINASNEISNIEDIDKWSVGCLLLEIINYMISKNYLFEEFNWSLLMEINKIYSLFEREENKKYKSSKERFYYIKSIFSSEYLFKENRNLVEELILGKETCIYQYNIKKYIII